MMFTISVMAPVAVALLGTYLLGVLYAITAPARQPDPQRGQAIGCLMFVAIGIGVLLLLAGLGWYFQVAWLVTLLFWVAVFPAVSLVGSAVYNGLMKMRR